MKWSKLTVIVAVSISFFSWCSNWFVNTEGSDAPKVVVVKNEVVKTEDIGNAEKEASSTQPKPRVSTNNAFPSNRQKDPKVLEKERQMKFLLENFPNVDAMVSSQVNKLY